MVFKKKTFTLPVIYISRNILFNNLSYQCFLLLEIPFPLSLYVKISLPFTYQCSLYTPRNKLRYDSRLMSVLSTPRNTRSTRCWVAPTCWQSTDPTWSPWCWINLSLKPWGQILHCRLELFLFGEICFPCIEKLL